MNYDALTADEAQLLEQVLVSSTVFFVITTIISLALTVLLTAGVWKILTKAGEEGWKALIPIYNMVIFFKIVGINPWMILITYGCMLIPFVGVFAPFIVGICFCHKAAMVFGKGILYTIGLCLFPYVFFPMLGFGKAEYIPPVQNTEIY